MKNILKLGIIAVFLAAIVSFLPVAELYLAKEPAPYTNKQAIERLSSDKTGDFRFAVFSDNHAGLMFDDGVALKVVSRINSENRFKKTPLEFVLTAGDITYRGSPWQFRIFNILRSRIKFPVICAAGNHDDDTEKTRNLYKKYCGANEFSFAYRNSYFIVLDSTIGSVTDKQFAWLESRLEKSAPYAHRFIVMHKPAVSPYQQAWYQPEMSQWSYRFLKLCEKYNVDIVFSGHEHMFKSSSYGGVKYITTGGGGMLPNFPSSEGGYNHYVVVRVMGAYVDYEVRRISPPLWELLTYYLWKDLFFALKDVFS
jgi:3',5'-cyclic AMP phosphodiesterase CpdA